MKLQTIILLAACALTFSAARAQEGLPRKVENVKLLDLEGNAAKLPYFGEKNLMIFYVDPDRHKQNEDFTIELEQNHRADSENIYGFGVMNLKDAPMIPNGMARNMARKRTEKNGATVLAAFGAPEEAVQAELTLEVAAVEPDYGIPGGEVENESFTARAGGMATDIIYFAFFLMTTRRSGTAPWMRYGCSCCPREMNLRGTVIR